MHDKEIKTANKVSVVERPSSFDGNLEDRILVRKRSQSLPDRCYIFIFL